jgi:hypothetical protein
MGVVEAINDPLKLGRMKVRIFGWHTPELAKMPTKTLPWASPMNAVNASKSFSTPIVGDYVVGFFGDGESAQAPIVMGVLPGIKQEDGAEDVGFSEFANKYDKDPENEIRPKSIAEFAELKVYKATTTGTQLVNITAPASKKNAVGKPSTPNVSQEYSPDGVIATLDEYRVHICDVKNNILFQEAVEKLKKYIDFTAIRNAIEAITGGLAASPIATQIASAIKAIRAFVRILQEAVDFVNEIILEITRYIAYVRQMIQYILSLPAQLAALFAQCLQELYSALSGALTFSIESVAGSDLIGEIKGLVSDGITLFQSTQSTLEAGQALVAETELLADPKTYSLP